MASVRAATTRSPSSPRRERCSPTPRSRPRSTRSRPRGACAGGSSTSTTRSAAGAGAAASPSSAPSPGPFETIRTMLRRNPRLQVLALHDATAPGCRLARQLATSPEWFKDLDVVTDVGLRPGLAGPFMGLLLPNEGGAVLAGEGITPSEAQWLSRYALELAAIRPEQVLKRLFRAINRKADEDETDDTMMSGDGARNGGARVARDDAALAADAGDSDGGADAFG